jgi:hypothetical protein
MQYMNIEYEINFSIFSNQFKSGNNHVITDNHAHI